MNGLYRTFKSNYVPYFEDGMGRDRYIAYNNAGFFHNSRKYLGPANPEKTGTLFGTKIIQHNKSPSIKAPNFHYHSDGSGRDKYILVNGGGLFYQSKPLLSYQLTDFLRKSDNRYYTPTNKRIALSRDEIKYNKLLRSKEKDIIKRLYTNEKRKFIKRKKLLPLNWISSDKIINDKNDIINKTNINTYFLNKHKYKIKEKENLTSKENGDIYEKDNFQINNYTSSNNNNNYSHQLKVNKIKYRPKLIIDAENSYNDNKMNKLLVKNSYKQH